jgi:hypothetical protein
MNSNCSTYFCWKWLDQRSSLFQDGDGRLLTRFIYKASTQGDQSCPAFKFFAWLLTHDRIHCRTNLVHKNILQQATCEICGEADESADHIFSGCNFVAAFCQAIGWMLDGIALVTHLWETITPPRIHKEVAHSIIILYC